MPKLHKYTVAFTDDDMAIVRKIQTHFAIIDGSRSCTVDRAIRFLIRDTASRMPVNGLRQKKKSIERVQRQRRRASA